MIPPDIDTSKLIGPERGVHPAIFCGEDKIYWNQSKTNFVIIYTIYEHSMGDNAGSLAWGCKQANDHSIQENPQNIYARCWGSPACVWIDNDTFIFKIGVYHPERKTGQKMRVPLVAININEGYQIVPDSDFNESRPVGYAFVAPKFVPFNSEGLLDAVKKQP